MVQIGSLLRQREQQYVANRDKNGTWRILDTWHKSLEGINPSSDDIPDDHPAVTIISEGAFIAMMKEAISSGVLDGIGNFNATSLEQDIADLKVENKKFIEKLKFSEELGLTMAKRETALGEEQQSESFQLKSMAMDTLKRMAAMGELDDVSKQTLLKVVNGPG